MVISPQTVSPVVDCAFGLFPASPESTLPADNGYLLYGAVSRVLPWIPPSSHSPRLNGFDLRVGYAR